MQKNRLFIVLACLNCAHTTHAVDSTNDTSVFGDKKNRYFFNTNDDMFYDQKFLINLINPIICGVEHKDPRKENIINFQDRDLANQYLNLTLQRMRAQVAQRLKDADMYKDALVKAAEILLKLDTAATQNYMEKDPLLEGVVTTRQKTFEGVVKIRQEILDDLRKQNVQIEELRTPEDYMDTGELPKDHMSRRFEEKLEELFKEIKISLPSAGSYEKILYGVFPDLNHKNVIVNVVEDLYPCEVFSLVSDNGFAEWGTQLQQLQHDYPNVANQVRNLWEKAWTHDVNRQLDGYIQGKKSWFDDIGHVESVLEKLDQSNTEPGQVIKNAILDQIYKDLFNSQQRNRQENAATLLAKNPELLKRMTAGKMVLAKIMHHRDTIQGHLGNVKKPMLPDIGKY